MRKKTVTPIAVLAVIALLVMAAAPLVGQASGEPRVTLLIRVLALRPVLEAAAKAPSAEAWTWVEPVWALILSIMVWRLSPAMR